MSLVRFTQRLVQTVEGSCVLVEAARRMIQKSVGALVITDASGTDPIGIITDRDLVVLIAEGLDPNEATVGALSKAPLASVSVNATLREVTDLMHKHGVRRLPIIDAQGQLAGLVSLDDVLVELSHELSDAAGAISEEISHERAYTGAPDD